MAVFVFLNIFNNGTIIQHGVSRTNSGNISSTNSFSRTFTFPIAFSNDRAVGVGCHTGAAFTTAVTGISETEITFAYSNKNKSDSASSGYQCYIAIGH